MLTKLLVSLAMAVSFTRCETPASLQLDSTARDIDGSNVSILKSCDDSLPLPAAWPTLPDKGFTPLRGHFLNIGVQPCPFLIRIHLEVQRAGPWYLQSEYPVLDQVQIATGSRISKHLGSALPWSHPLGLNTLTIPVTLDSGKSDLHLAIFDPSGSVVFPLRLLPEQALARETQQANLVQGIFLGAFLILFLASLAAAFIFRRAAHFYYSFHLSQALGYALVHCNLAFPWFWSNHPEINQWCLTFFALTTGASMGLFANSWINFSGHYRKLGRIHAGIAWGLLGCAALHPLHPWFPSLFQMLYRTQLMALSGIVMTSIGLGVSASLAWKGNPRAREYLVAISPYFLTAAFSILLIEGDLEGNYETQSYALMIGSLLEILLLGGFLFSSLGRNRRRHQKLLHSHRLLESRQIVLRTEAAEEERRGLARELHDDMGQRIAAMRLMLRSASNPAILELFGQELSEMQVTLRHLTRSLHPLELERDGLARALEALASRMPLDVKFFSSPDWTDPETPVAIHLYRMCQEMLGNALKHSRAAHIAVSLFQKGPDRWIVINDDGIGFDAQQSSAGLGRPGLKERADLLGAKLDLETALGSGCCWKIRLSDF